ncbi:CHASE2 domain-containing protein [Variovorax sp. ZT4R33]|uniref:CHASE2 domain-containing protein n=1 Tax=Variovorax sp. ZT4R33 TaxID=3443743 RepID=UPI003F487556
MYATPPAFSNRSSPQLSTLNTYGHDWCARWIRWAALASFALALVIGLDVSGLVLRPNLMLQDALVRSQGRDVRQSDVIVVAIDEPSLAALGNWPWRKTTHAALIDRLMQDAPRVIGLDILFAEPDERFPDDGRVLAGALERSGRVVLPTTMALQGYGHSPLTLGPVCRLAGSAKRLGLDRLPVDQDGVLRNVYLREGLRDFELDHFSLAMLQVGAPDRFSADVPGSLDKEVPPHTPPSGRWLDWRRSHKMVVPFAGPPGHFRRISYIDVITGAVPHDTFRGKYVLVGPTAAELGSLYATPAADREQPMAGVEVNANVLDSLLGEHEVAIAPPWLNTGLNVSVVVLALVGMAFIEPLSALLLTVALALALLVISTVGRTLLHLQFGPMAGLLGLSASYALWSWSRLNTAARYLIEASMHLRESANIAPAPWKETRPSGDFLDRRIKTLSRATRQLRDLNRLVSDTLDSLPDATLVCDRQGSVGLANAAAARYFHAASSEAMSNMSVIELLQRVHSTENQRPVVTPESLSQSPCAGTVSARDHEGRDLLVKHAPSLRADGWHAGWILSLVDVTEISQAQRQHDEAIHFMSHDIRAPQSAILTLLELDRHDPATMSPAQFRERIGRHAQKALALSEGFIQLARARSQPYRLGRCDLASILVECIDDTWEARQRRRIQVILASASLPEAHGRVDRDLVSRAIDNLLGNALTHAPMHSAIICAVEPHEDGWAIRVQDQGPGISPDKQAAIFEPFERGASPPGCTPGAGLGLAFVKAVAVRHGGRISLQSAPGCGCTFRLVLPKMLETAA